MDLHQILPGGFLAAQTPLDELKVLVQNRSSTLTRPGGCLPWRGNLCNCGNGCHEVFVPQTLPKRVVSKNSRSSNENEDFSSEVRTTFYPVLARGPNGRKRIRRKRIRRTRALGMKRRLGGVL